MTKDLDDRYPKIRDFFQKEKTSFFSCKGKTKAPENKIVVVASNLARARTDRRRVAPAHGEKKEISSFLRAKADVFQKNRGIVCLESI